MLARAVFLAAALVACVAADADPVAALTVGKTQAMKAGVDEVTAMARDGSFIYSLTDHTIIKASAADISDFGEDDLHVHAQGPWDSLTTVSVDDDALYVTGRYQGDNVDVNGEALKGRYQIIKFDKTTMAVKSTLNIPEQDNIPYAMRQTDTHLFLGMYSFPGRVVRVLKSVQGTDLMQIVDSLVLETGFDDVRSLEFDNTDPGFLYANCNTMPGRVVKINLQDPQSGLPSPMTVKKTLTLDTGVGHFLSGTGTTKMLAYTGSNDHMIYVATNQAPARVVKISTRFMTVEETVTLDAGEDSAACMVMDAEYVYVGLYTSPAKIVRVNKQTMQRESAITLAAGFDRAAGMVQEQVGDKLSIFVGTFSKPAAVVELDGALMPRNCTMGAWSAYGSCSRTCGVGQQGRQRSVVTSALNGGLSCAAMGGLVESKPCSNDRCAKTCHDGLVFSTTMFAEPLTCDNKAHHDKALARGPGTQGKDGKVIPGPLLDGCQCPADRPYLHSLGEGGGTMCLAVCTNAYSVCPAGSTSCVYDAGRIRVLHGKCQNAERTGLHNSECSQNIPETNHGALGYQYHCRHKVGRIGGCQCLCYTPVEEHCEAPPTSLENGSFQLVGSGGYHIGAEATYSCNAGFTLTGSFSRVCLSNKEWSGFPPACVAVHTD